MRRTLFVCVVLVALAAVPAQAVKVGIDYDRETDFSKFKTFAWMNTDDVSLKDSEPLMDSRIKNAIEHAITTRGMIEDPDDPDILITYYGEEKEQISINTTHYGYGYGGGYGYYGYPYGYGGLGMGTSSATVSTYTVGTLIIDAVEAKEKKLIWRATASDTIPESPQKQAKKIEKAIKKIMKQWDNITILDAKEKEKAKKKGS